MISNSTNTSSDGFDDVLKYIILQLQITHFHQTRKITYLKETGMEFQYFLKAIISCFPRLPEGLPKSA